MGIFCEINLFKPLAGAYHPGQAVTGLIRYALDEPMKLEGIIISLKGSGSTVIKIKRKDKTDTHSSSEVYVDVDNVVQGKEELSVGAYEVKFKFILPPNIPSSLNVHKSTGRYRAMCNIKYNIRIKFKKSGYFSVNKYFKKEINVISEVITPSLSMEPLIYGELKKLMRLFSSKRSEVNIKATILNSVIVIGGKIEVNYEVENNSSVVIRSIETKLMQKYKFFTAGHNVEIEDDIPDTDVKTSSIKIGCKENLPTEIIVPSYLHSIENSKLISRHYVVRLIAELPIPHINAYLNIPVQIGSVYEEEQQFGYIHEDITREDAPPTYWEAMGEEKEKEEKLESSDKS